VPGRVFTESERKRLDAFPSEIAELDLIRYFTLSGSDLVFVRQQRRRIFISFNSGCHLPLPTVKHNLLDRAAVSCGCVD
jgi:hypothetical protein